MSPNAVIGASTVAGASMTVPQWVHLSSATDDIPAPGPSKQQTANLMLDVDRDGHEDFIIAARVQGPAITWFRRTLTGWSKYIIDSAFLPIEAGGTSLDIDRDGDLDIVFGGDSSSNKVWWWENPYPNYDPNIHWTRRTIKSSGGNQHHDQLAGDFDGDGKQELAFWNQGARKLFIAEIPDNPKNTTPWPYNEIFSWNSGTYEGLTKFDMDGDGIMDIVGGGRWFKYQNGNDYVANIIDKDQTVSRVAVGQLKEGGWPEVVLVLGDGVGQLKWYERTSGKWVGHSLLKRDVVHGHSLEIADINGDGHLDIFCAEMRQWSSKDDNPNAKMWFFFGDGRGHFEKTVVASGLGNHESKVADLDGDGDLDLLSKPYTWDTPRIDVWLNKGTRDAKDKLSLDKWQRHVVDSRKPWRSIFIDSADIDGNGLTDIITGGWWYKNPGTTDAPWERNLIGQPLKNMAVVYDFDRDGDQDILGTQGKGSEANEDFAWARNDGKGKFTVLDNIPKARGDFLQGVVVAPFHNLAPVEVALSWHRSGYGVQALTVPFEPERKRWEWRTLSDSSQDEQLSVGDIDRDGSLDLLLGTKWLCNECLQHPLWLKKLGQWGIELDSRAKRLDQWLGTNWFRWRVRSFTDTAGTPDRNRLIDMNSDGRLDAVVGFEAINVPGKLVWYEQPANVTNTWAEHKIAEIVAPMSLDVTDMDGDGDMDVVAGEHNLKSPSTAALYVFENTNGKGTAWLPHVVYKGDEHHDGAIAVDIDGDGDLDIMSIGWGHSLVLLYENRAISE